MTPVESFCPGTELCLQGIILGVHLFLFHLSLLLLQKLFEKVNIILGTITIVLNILTAITIIYITLSTTTTIVSIILISIIIISITLSSA